MRSKMHVSYGGTVVDGICITKNVPHHEGLKLTLDRFKTQPYDEPKV